MTVSEIAPAISPDKAHEWTDSDTSKLPHIPNKLASRLDAKAKMRLSVQMARIRAKLPSGEIPKLPQPISNRKSVDNIDDVAAIAADDGNAEKTAEPQIPLTPPPPCNACILSDGRHFVLNLLNVESDPDQEPVEPPIKDKDRKSLKRICGWDSSTNLLCKKPTTAADSRSLTTAKAAQRRSLVASNSAAADVKVKINLYDRYTANAVSESFKFFHYTDLRLYIKQYRRNHSCGLGNRTHMANVSPVYDGNMQRYDYGYERTRSYLKTSDGFMLGLNSTAANSQFWKGNVPIPSSFRQKFLKEKKQQPQVVEEPLLSPRVFVRQNGAFSHLWKTREDGIPDPYIAITRPPTTQPSTRPASINDHFKESQRNWTPSPTKSSRGHDSPGDLNRETPAWRIMQMIASCSQHPSRTDGSSSTTTNECKSRTSDIDSNRDPERSQGTGEISSSSLSPEESPENANNSSENGLSNLKKKYGLMANIQAANNDRPVVYNNTRSILSNMSNLLNYYIESEAQEVENSSTPNEDGNKKLEEAARILDKNAKDAAQRKKLVLLRKELKNIASRRSPSRQNFPSSSDLAKVGSLVLPGSKNFETSRPVRCNTSPQNGSRLHVRKVSPSPTKTGYSGYKKVLSNAEQRDNENKPILFVKRSQLLPTVVSSVEAMKSKQVMLHSRNAPQPQNHPADSKQFTKITDLLKGQVRVPPNTASGTRRIIHNGNGHLDARPVYSSNTRRK